MRYDRNYAYFRPHFDWYTFKVGVGFVPTEKAPPEAVEAMEKYNSYTYRQNPNMSKAEKKALYEKLENPEKTVICPRCGNEIIYEVRGNSVAVECTRPNCIYGGLRGL